MTSRSRGLWRAAVAAGIVACCFTWSGAAEPADSPPESSAGAEESDQRVSVEVARDRARLMHRIYSATLEVLHDRYFHGDRAVVPARAMEDVFDALERESDVTARWISVNTKPMSITHEPETAFERLAAKEIAGGKSDVEVVENGIYRRAGAIPLAQGCVSCHTGFFGKPDKKPRFAGLVISIPVRSGSSPE
jgi:hypothetical protein